MASAPEQALGGTDGIDADGKRLPFVLGIVGDSGSGKSTISKGVRQLLDADRVAEVKLDDYHRYTREERREKGLTALNPLVHNLSLLQEHLQLLRKGRQIRNRSYEHKDGTFGPIRVIEPRDIILARGLLGFPSEALRAQYDLAVFLMPEPDLLFRWKLRRDMRTRGYSEAEVLKNIAQHLVDSKSYVVPQGERADLVVRYRLDDYEDPDSKVHTSMVLRGSAAAAAEELLQKGGLADRIQAERVNEELVLQIPPELGSADIESWGRALFPDFADWGRIGECQAEESGTARHVPLGFVQILVAGLTRALRDGAAGLTLPAAAGA
jgi:phosphoribulokinase